MPRTAAQSTTRKKPGPKPGSKRATPRKAIEPMEMDLAKPDDVDIPSTGALPDDLQPRVIERTIDPHNIDNKAKSLAFMEEKVVCMIHESTDENAEKIVQLGVNGRNVFLERGVPYRLARKYVARLAQMKTHGVKTVEIRGQDGERMTQVQRTSALAYPFSVTQDDNPQGAAWLRNLLKQH